MKRDFDLIRELLLQFEAKEDAAVVERPEVEGQIHGIVAYHCRLLHDAGFLRCEPVRSSSSDRLIDVLPFELTWDGHEFLDKIRLDSTWSRIKAYSKEKGFTLSFTIVTELAKRLATQVMDGLSP